MLTVKAPAKINLTLEVLRQRSDGYHEIRSVLQTIDLYDTLHIEKSKDVIWQCDSTEWSAEKSLLYQTVNLLKATTGCLKGAEIKIEKRIPMLAGLGGDSSGAAALLHGLNELWELGLSPEKLRELSIQLGSDVAFFPKGGTAMVEGRGEIVTPLPSLRRMWVVLVVPDILVEPGKTGRMYAYLRPGHYTEGKITSKLVNSLHKVSAFDYSMLFNTFENVAFNTDSGLDVYKEHLVKLGATNIHLAGSGPALFTLFEHKNKAEELYAHCQAQ